MKDFEEIDFDSPRGIVDELSRISGRLRGMMDHLAEEELNDLNDFEQRHAEKLAGKLERSADALLNHSDSFVNGIWHEMDVDEKSEILSWIDNEAEPGTWDAARRLSGDPSL